MRNIPVTARSNLIRKSTTIQDDKSDVLTAKISLLVSKPVDIYDCVDDLKIVEVKCGKTTTNGIVDAGVPISVVREDLAADMVYEGEGKIEINSTFGESETTLLIIIEMKINDNLLGDRFKETYQRVTTKLFSIYYAQREYRTSWKKLLFGDVGFRIKSTE
ncbi:retrovirus-related Pol polyprotein from transposon opus [Nephila pilipes]|uniref:Retrovirus-related Pol polyprotein from transposon opus n=1 Tax=Nephila pilipes TaxID=299642 RepID=A0A8X6MTY7_NEPPI|nr:retrovirus-related Pol polyprotein from transposon opus [Nephila pilipes]